MSSLKTMTKDKKALSGGSELCFLLENIRSASNIGSIFRTADAFGIKRIYLCGICAVPPNKEILKTALGATVNVPWEYHEDASLVVNQLRVAGNSTILALEQSEGSSPLASFTPELNSTLIVILGNELEGVSKPLLEKCDHVLEIPQYGLKKSLNVAVVAGIAAWELSNKIIRKK